MPNEDLSISCMRGGNYCFPYRCDNNDLLDSTLYIYRGIIIQEKFPFCNTDFSNGYKGGILAEGDYDFIIGLHKGKRKAAFLCKDLKKTDKWDSLTLKQRTLPSLIPNPNHGGKRIITGVNTHPTMGDWDGNGIADGDGSQGCITILGKEYYKFENIFKLNDRGRFKLERMIGWTPPAIYG